MYTDEITEDMIRNYAPKEIVEALDKSIEAHFNASLLSYRTFMAEEPDEAEIKKLSEGAHRGALGWIIKKYYTVVADPSTEEQKQAQINRRLLLIKAVDVDLDKDYTIPSMELIKCSRILQ